METIDLRYPIGKFDRSKIISDADHKEFIQSIEHLPSKLRTVVEGLSDVQLDTPYRDGGWTIRQVVHHLADSHINSYMRFKLALTEDKPTIKPYDEVKWAELSDGKNAPIEISLALLESLHSRWTILLKSLGSEEFKKTFVHPASGEVSLEKTLGLYAWHGAHHIAHITSLKKRMGW